MNRAEKSSFLRTFEILELQGQLCIRSGTHRQPSCSKNINIKRFLKGVDGWFGNRGLYADLGSPFSKLQDLLYNRQLGTLQ
ncbi:hypothetical protein MPTK1_3g07990 [Marchantia polymorpha subsp. ruderalis]|uniref:Uncharacterized protein n=2 Tax=Marchantia polymorpha TaxID=3197 RepID=A0AAF6AYJ6_MARPO|nr:hypothetical protein MARPO_0006s0276 [Marchantia polymorpha]BBN04830.1 hypothetical protein Mp_3g07990 [Marchantia polymorpha subsp. ruderalis]|eukprot:PTQ48283.1 hypothetical protein MARPO_0006s0276 [Marchantia polymorpha]